MIRPDEGDLGSARRSLAELGEEEGETRAQALLVRSANTLHDFTGELVAEQAPAVERVPNRRANRLHLVAFDLRMQDTGRVPPGGQLAGRAGDGPPGRMPKGQLTGRMQVESSAQRPRFYEEPAFPEGFLKVALGHPVDAQAKLELCGSLNLGVHAAEVMGDANEPIRGRSFEKG